MGAMAYNLEARYVGWEEVVVSSDKGTREVHYFLKRRGGGRDLAVLGKEKSVRNMMYDYAIQETDFLLPVLNRVSGLKLRTRREVIDWLNSLVSDGQLTAFSRLSCDEKENKVKTDMMMDTRIPFLNHHIPGFAWLGSSWACRKQRHYESFCRNGAVVSIQDFVHVLSEENKRLIAYLEDMYEDVQGNNMVLVRWFHKIDEVGFDLPSNYNDREIFFSRCLQEISVECIDGQATVLSPEHYQKLSNEAAKMGIFPFVCYRQFDDNDIKEFEVTGIGGYWKQELLRKRASLLEIPDALKMKRSSGDAFGSSPNKRNSCFYDGCICLKFPHAKRSKYTRILASEGTALGHKEGSLKDGSLHPSLPDEKDKMQKFPQPFTIGSCIEVLSQDSGIRGCWFRASIIKRHKDKIKIKYQDVKDAVDDSKNLEEWIATSRIASRDASGIRLFGRPMCRPAQLNGGTVCHPLNTGSIVDAWWHDGWWEGIVVKIELSDKIIVYFPGENRESSFSLKDLRHSKEWFYNCWQVMDDRPDIASRYHRPIDAKKDGFGEELLKPKSQQLINEGDGVARDLLKDNCLFRLRWVSSGKRRHKRGIKTHSCANIMSRHERSCFDKVFSNSSLKFDSVTPLSNVLMSV